MKFMVMVCAAFFARVKPVSTSAKPACMNITRKPAPSVQTKLMATVLASISPSGVRSDSQFVHDTHSSVYIMQFATTAHSTTHDYSCIICTNMHTLCREGKGKTEEGK